MKPIFFLFAVIVVTMVHSSCKKKEETTIKATKPVVPNNADSIFEAMSVQPSVNYIGQLIANANYGCTGLAPNDENFANDIFSCDVTNKDEDSLRFRCQTPIYFKGIEQPIVIDSTYKMNGSGVYGIFRIVEDSFYFNYKANYAFPDYCAIVSINFAGKLHYDTASFSHGK